MNISEIKARWPTYIDNPLMFAEEVVGFHPDEQQTPIIANYQKNRFTTVKSGHGCGKTALASVIGLHFLVTRPFSIVPCTAPSQPQLYNVLWKEFHKWISGSEFLRGSVEWTAKSLKKKGRDPHGQSYGPRWYAVARTARSKSGDDTNVGLQGFHAGPQSGGLQFIVDEASGVPDSSIATLDGAMTEKNNFALMIANPTHLSGAFYRSHHRDSNLWKAYTLSCEKSAFVDPEYMSTMAQKYGKDSDQYRIRVLGEFPKSEEFGLIPIAFVQQSFQDIPSQELDTDGNYIRPEGAIDIALGGKNKTIAFLKRGNNVFWKGVCNEIHEDKIAEWIEDLILRFRVKRFSLDGPGVGSGVLSHLRKNDKVWGVIHKFNPGGTPLRPGKDDEFLNLRAQCYWHLRTLFYNNSVVLSYQVNDDNVATQLSSIQVIRSIDLKRLKIEGKDRMIQRGMESPDDADALMMLFAGDLIEGVREKIPEGIANFDPSRDVSQHPILSFIREASAGTSIFDMAIPGRSFEASHSRHVDDGTFWYND